MQYAAWCSIIETLRLFLVPRNSFGTNFRYPISYDRWLGFEAKVDGRPTFIPSGTDDGLKMDYVYCKHGPKGKVRRARTHLRNLEDYGG